MRVQAWAMIKKHGTKSECKDKDTHGLALGLGKDEESILAVLVSPCYNGFRVFVPLGKLIGSNL